MSDQILNSIEKQLRLLGKFEVECVIVGGIAATLHGSEIPTTDLGVCYARNPANLDRLASALRTVHARLRNAPEDLPFILDSETLRRGLNFTFATDIGSIDLLGELRGLGYFEEVFNDSVIFDLFGYRFPVLNITKLIIAKRIAGRQKDLRALPELEAIKQRQAQDEPESLRMHND